jgi:heme A synthase
MMNTTSENTRASRRDVRQHARHQVIGLAAQFLLGMAVSLIGQPSETTGAAHTASNVLLGLHVLVAVVLIAGAAGVIRATRGRGQQRRLARWGAAAIVLTFGAGIATLITKSNWWSYAMAVGFLVALLVYVGLLVQATSAHATSAAGQLPEETVSHPQ